MIDLAVVACCWVDGKPMPFESEKAFFFADIMVNNG